MEGTSTELQQVAIRLSGFTVCTLDIAFRFEKSSGEQNLGQSEILVDAIIYRTWGGMNFLHALGWTIFSRHPTTLASVQ
jgi:hypothetical protein